MFQLSSHNTTVRTELMAGLTTFVTVSYIVAVNAAILAQTGMPYEAVILSTVLAALLGGLLMAFRANAPLVLVPGMGDNAFFAYTLVLAMGLTWRQGLTAVLMAGLVFAAVSFLPRAAAWIRAIPESLVGAMATGIGLFLAFLGLEKGGLIARSEATIVTLGDLGSPHALTSLITLAVLLVLLSRKINGSYLIAMIVGTLAGIGTGIVDLTGLRWTQVSFASYGTVFLAFDFSALASPDFWIAVFSLSIMVIFQNIGAQLGMLPDRSKFRRSLQANALSIVGAGIVGCSSTVSSAESVTGITAGGRTGLTSLTAGLLFVPLVFALPLLRLIPDSAIAPILIVVGGLMFGKAMDIPFDDLTEGVPAFLLIAAIPLTFSVAHGIAIGFIAWTLLKLAAGRASDIRLPMYALSAVCLLYLFVEAVA